MSHTWNDIKDHSCGRYKDEMDKRIDEAQRNHKRYMHYFEHWKDHVASHAKEKADRWGWEVLGWGRWNRGSRQRWGWGMVSNVASHTKADRWAYGRWDRRSTERCSFLSWLCKQRRKRTGGD